MTAPVILLEATPKRTSDGAAVTVRLAGGGDQVPYRYGANDWLAGIVQLPTLITSIDFGVDENAGGEFGEGGVPQAISLQWAPSSMAKLADISGRYWFDAAVTVRIGPEDPTLALPAIALSGKALSATISGGVMTIAMSDPAADLKKPLLTARYGGTGDLDGPAEWQGKIKRRVWGRVWNVALEPIDKAYNIYSVADPLKPLQAIDAVRDQGAPAASLTIVGWAGSAAATLAVLRAASVPEGGACVAPSISCLKWWTVPGALHADVRGEIGAGYVETTGAIVERIVQSGANTPFAAGTVAAAVTARPAPVGWIAKDDSTSQASMIQELLGNSSLLWLIDSDGKIAIREWAWGASVKSARSSDVKRVRTLRPTISRQLGYRRNESPMARGDLAGIVLVYGANTLTNSELTVDADGWFAPTWTSWTTATGANFTNGRNLGGGYGGNPINLLYQRFGYNGLTPVPADKYVFGPCQRGFDGNLADLKRYGLWVEPGERIYARALIAIHGGVEGHLRIEFFDSTGAYIPGSATDSVQSIGDGRLGGPTANPATLANLVEVYVLVDVPIEACYAAIGTWGRPVPGGVDPSFYIFVGQAMLSKVAPGQNERPPYVPGASNRAADRTGENTSNDTANLGGVPTATVLSNINGAAANAQQAIDELDDLADDALITSNEKITKLIPKAAQLEASYTSLATLAGALGVSTTTAASARSAWLSMLAALSPAWNTTLADTPVVRSSYNTTLNAYEGALTALAADCAAMAATKATWATVTGSGKPEDNATAGGIFAVSNTNPGTPSNVKQLWVKPSTKQIFQWSGTLGSGSWVDSLGSLAQYNSIIANLFVADQGVDLAAMVPGTINWRASLIDSTDIGPSHSIDTGIVALGATAFATAASEIEITEIVQSGWASSSVGHDFNGDFVIDYYDAWTCRYEIYYRLNGGAWVDTGIRQTVSNAGFGSGPFFQNSAPSPSSKFSPGGAGILQLGVRWVGSHADGSGTGAIYDRIVRFEIVNWK